MDNMPTRPRRADYILYTWQIRAIQRMSRDSQRPSSEILRDLLSEALMTHAPSAVPVGDSKSTDE